MKNKIKVINFKDEHDKQALELFYRHVFYKRKEFEYARYPSWIHRYSLEENSIKRLAVDDGKIVGSLGLIPYNGYINGRKTKIGFFVDNCVLPERNWQYDEIFLKLFKSVEKTAKKTGIEILAGWDYTRNMEAHKELFKKMGYSRIDGINWFGGGTKHVHLLPNEEFKLHFFWRIAFKLLFIKHRIFEFFFKPLKNEKIREMKNSDLPEVVKLINAENEKLDFSKRYTLITLKEMIEKYNAQSLVAETKGKITGALLTFVAPWSGWMYGKPFYTKTHALFLIKHPLEFAVNSENAEKTAAHLLFYAMNDEKKGKYLFFVDVFDRRISWMRKAYLDTGAEELPYDYGTLFFKNLSGKKILLNKPVYIPTNLVINPYTAKDY